MFGMHSICLQHLVGCLKQQIIGVLFVSIFRSLGKPLIISYAGSCVTHFGVVFEADFCLCAFSFFEVYDSDRQKLVDIYADEVHCHCVSPCLGVCCVTYDVSWLLHFSVLGESPFQKK